MRQVPEQAKRDLLAVCRRLYARGLVAGTDGNVSLRFSKDLLLATPTGMSKGFLGADDLVLCDLEGRQQGGGRRLTTEIKIHTAVYVAREDVCAVVHAHPPYATAFAVAGLTPSENLMPEAYLTVGKVALAPYGTPSTDELADSLRPFVRDHDAILLSNHGAVAMGRDVRSAYDRMEALEQLCRISSIARQLGGARALSKAQLEQLESIRGVYGVHDPKAPCWNCGLPPLGAGADAAHSAPAAAAATSRPTAYVEPAVHWAGNPPVWERPGFEATIEAAQVRDAARRILRTLRTE
jgi:L-fuculose-phosphate aldolase